MNQGTSASAELASRYFAPGDSIRSHKLSVRTTLFQEFDEEQPVRPNVAFVNHIL